MLLHIQCCGLREQGITDALMPRSPSHPDPLPSLSISCAPSSFLVLSSQPGGISGKMTKLCFANNHFHSVGALLPFLLRALLLLAPTHSPFLRQA